MHEEIKVLIIEDEEMWSASYKATLHDFGYTVAGKADNFESAISLLNTADFDIVLLDIHINNKNSGIEIGKMINTLYHKPFIFITGSSDSHLLADVIAARPSAYLTKPVHPSSLIATLQSAIDNFSNNVTPARTTTDTNNDIFFVKQGNRYKKLNWAQIVFLQSDKNYTIIFNAADKTEYFIRSSMSKTLNYIIPGALKSSFVQINRAEAVNVAFINEFTGDEVRTAFKTLTLTEAYSNHLKEVLRLIA